MFHPKTSNVEKIPFRVVMNNETISFKEYGKGQALTDSFSLKDLNVVELYKEDPNCLKIGQTAEKYKIMCEISDPNETRAQEFKIKNWIRDIQQFRDDCHKDEEGPKINIDKDPRLIKLKMEIAEENVKGNLDQLDEKQRKENEKTLKLAMLISLKTLEKERTYEERLEQEELLRERKEDEVIKKEYQCEEMKKTNLLKALIINRDAENQNKLKLKEKLTEIENELKLKLVTNRNNTMRKINLLRLSHERKKNKLRMQISEMRKTLNQSVLEAERIGDSTNCINSLLNLTFTQYCSLNFTKDPETLTQCKVKDNFCYICCENEFGEMHKDERENCLESCQKINESKNKCV